MGKVDQMEDTYVTVEVDESQKVMKEGTAEADTKGDDNDDDEEDCDICIGV